MTANTMAGDRGRCLAAGMDSYISKPIRSRDLFDTITRVVHGVDNGTPPPDEAARAAAAGLNWSAMLDTVGGDRELLEIAAAVLEEAPRLLTNYAPPRSRVTPTDCAARHIRSRRRYVI